MLAGFYKTRVFFYNMTMDYINFFVRWARQLEQVSGVRFRCGHCGADAGVVDILRGTLLHRAGANAGNYASILFCPVCSQPTYQDIDQKQFPAYPLGADLKNLPAGIAGLYREARNCSGVGAYTACVMACRKILMNLAVREGAKEGGSFVGYVDYLADNNFVPPKGKVWVTKIKDKGNDANHEITEMSEPDAKEIMMLVEMLLRFNFELGDPTAQSGP